MIDDEFEIEVDTSASVEFQWTDIDGEEVLLMKVENEFDDEGVIFNFDRETAYSMYEFLKREFEEPTIN